MSSGRREAKTFTAERNASNGIDFFLLLLLLLNQQSCEEIPEQHTTAAKFSSANQNRAQSCRFEWTERVVDSLTYGHTSAKILTHSPSSTFNFCFRL
jgi:hypothetical protein